MTSSPSIFSENVPDSEDKELNERVLDCYNRAYDDLAACNSSLGCTDNLAWAGCYIDWGIDIGQCPDTNTQVAVDIADCLN